MLSAACALPGATASVAIAVHKLELTLLQTFARGIGGGLLISLLTLTSNTDPGPELNPYTLTLTTGPGPSSNPNPNPYPTPDPRSAHLAGHLARHHGRAQPRQHRRHLRLGLPAHLRKPQVLSCRRSTGWVGGSEGHRGCGGRGQGDGRWPGGPPPPTPAGAWGVGE